MKFSQIVEELVFDLGLMESDDLEIDHEKIRKIDAAGRKAPETPRGKQLAAIVARGEKDRRAVADAAVIARAPKPKVTPLPAQSARKIKPSLISRAGSFVRKIMPT